MIELNLLPDIKKEFIKAQKSRNRVIAASVLLVIGSIGLTIVAFLYVVVGQQVVIAFINSDIESKTKSLQSKEDLGKYLTVQNQLEALPDLHANKTMYSRLYDYIPKLNPSAPNSVKLLTLVASDEDKTITFTGVTPTFQALNVFKDTLENASVEYKITADAETTKEKLFDRVTVQSAGLGRTSNRVLVNFTVLVNYKEEVFKASSSRLDVKVPNIKTTQSSLQSPKPVFDSGTGGGQ